ncbi:MAG: hypothetical protein PHW04_08915 [Candidatus Wallbacteria bacterium]|nr:hypothetical protein [Candidatus Wallbacteria bacterium]
MGWFENFVLSLEGEWAVYKNETLQEAEVPGSLEMVFCNSDKIRRVCDRFVTMLLMAKGYYSIAPLDHKSPADIFGFCEHKEFQHLVLIKVKSIGSDLKQSHLTEGEIKDLKGFCGFTFDKFRKEKPESRSVAVSCGYAVVSSEYNVCELYDSGLTGIDPGITDLEKKIRSVHLL